MLSASIEMCKTISLFKNIIFVKDYCQNSSLQEMLVKGYFLSTIQFKIDTETLG